MTEYIASIDQGTTSTRCMVFDHGGQVVAVAQKEHRQIYPQPGWVEHDPIEIWQRTQEVVKEALQKIGGASSRSLDWESPINARLPWSGIAVPDNLTAMPLSGRIHVRKIFAISWLVPAGKIASAPEPAYLWLHIFPVRR